MTKLIYTCIFGDYEQVQPININTAGYKCVIFTDNKELVVKGWNTVYVEPKDCPKKQSREVKINVHKFHKSDIYIYVDANYYIKNRFDSLLKRFFRGGYMTMPHPKRRCIYDEALEVIKQGKDEGNIVNAQMEKYQKENLPKRLGLFANGFFVRDNSFNDVCEDWYNEVYKHSHRDQLSLMYALWKYNKKVSLINYGNARQFIQLMPHKKEQLQKSNDKPNIYYFVPGAGDKNLGRELNKHCEIVPNDDDWILIRDNDTCFLEPYINKQIEDIINKHGNDFEIFSCLTNRLGLKYQTPYGLMDESDVLNLREKAKYHYDNFYDEVVRCKQPTAGLFILFQKKTWLKHKFDEGLANAGGFIDWRFTNGHLRKGSRIGICKGIFIFHYYRMHQDNAREYKHLI